MKKTCLFVAILSFLCLGVYRQSETESLNNSVGQAVELGTLSYSGSTHRIGYRCMVCEKNTGDRVFIKYQRGEQHDALEHIVQFHKGKVEALGNGSNPNIHFRYLKNVVSQDSFQANWKIAALTYRPQSQTYDEGYWCKVCNGEHPASASGGSYTKGTLEDGLKHILHVHNGKVEAIFSNYLDQWTNVSNIYFRYAEKIQNRTGK